jgi:hypothetical protein
LRRKTVDLALDAEQNIDALDRSRGCAWQGDPAAGPGIRPLRCFSAVSAILFRSAIENDGYSPVVPKTTTPSALWSLK